jgi:hypothetical protein
LCGEDAGSFSSASSPCQRRDVFRGKALPRGLSHNPQELRNWIGFVLGQPSFCADLDEPLAVQK